MKIKTIIGIVFIIIGVILSAISWFPSLGEGGGYLAVWLGHPLIIVGVLLLLSTIGTLIFILGIIVFVLGSNLMPHQSSAATQTTFAWIVGLLLGASIVYGLVEGIVKLVKRFKK